MDKKKNRFKQKNFRELSGSKFHSVILALNNVVSKALGKRIPDLQTKIQSLQDTLQAFQTEKGELSKEIQWIIYYTQ